MLIPQEELRSVIESFLFISEKPISLDRLSALFEASSTQEDIQTALKAISEKYSSLENGFELRESGTGYFFCTKTKNSEWIRKFLQTKPFRLGKSALETLAIIAYKQPITRSEIDHIRGIDSSHLMRTLIERGLVKILGKSELPGRPVQYGTTPRFLEVTGLKSLNELPPLSELEQLQGSQKEKEPTVEEKLDEVFKETRGFEEHHEEAEQELSSIDALISPIQPTSEIFESPLHVEIAKENELALQEFLLSHKPYKRGKATNELSIQ